MRVVDAVATALPQPWDRKVDYRSPTSSDNRTGWRDYETRGENGTKLWLEASENFGLLEA